MTFCKISPFVQWRKANFAPGSSVEAIGLFLKYVIFGMIVAGAFISTDHDCYSASGPGILKKDRFAVLSEDELRNNFQNLCPIGAHWFDLASKLP